MTDHEHTSACYRELPKQLSCSRPEHTHVYNCKNIHGQQVCGQHEHTHTESGCYSFAGYACTQL